MPGMARVTQRARVARLRADSTTSMLRSARCIAASRLAFSLAIDSTIHFLNRYHLEEERLPEPRGHQLQALRKTAHHIGPPVVMTTIILALGLGVTMLSNLPSLRLFGELTAVCLFASLIAQLVILPATISLYRRHFPKRM